MSFKVVFSWVFLSTLMTYLLLTPHVFCDLTHVLVSSDRSPEDMQSYMKESHGDWLAVEHNSTVANDLKQKYGEK